MDNAKSDRKGTERTPDKHWFTAQLARKELSQAQMAGRMGVDPVTLSYAVNGSRELKVSDAIKIAGVLDVPITEVMRRWGYEVPESDQPTAPVLLYAYDDFNVEEANAPVMRAPVPPGFAANGFALQVRSAAAVGGFWDGTIVYFEPGQFDESKCWGKLSLVETIDRKRLFGVLSRPHEPGRFRLINPGIRTEIEGFEIAKVTPAHWFKSQ